MDEYGNERNSLVKIGNYGFECGYRLFELRTRESADGHLRDELHDMTIGAITAAHERGVVLERDIGFVG